MYERDCLKSVERGTTMRKRQNSLGQAKLRDFLSLSAAKKSKPLAEEVDSVTRASELERPWTPHFWSILLIKTHPNCPRGVKIPYLGNYYRLKVSKNCNQFVKISCTKYNSRKIFAKYSCLMYWLKFFTVNISLYTAVTWVSNQNYSSKKWYETKLLNTQYV